eukprot:10021796-Alexandrium_andersonii.AAC.1
MSASLVGSEMCIRDRALLAGRAGPPLDPGLPAPLGRCRRSTTVCPTCRPVSYTHLTLPTICSV